MKKIGLLCLTLVMVLGSLGVAFAAWRDSVTINGTVQTGSVRVGIISQKSNDPVGNLDPAHGHVPLGNGSWSGLSTPDPASWTWNGDAYDKDVASCACSFTEDTLTMTIDSAYPSYGPDVIYYIKNLGTIPAKIESIKLVSVTTPSGTYPVDLQVDADFNNTVYMVANDGSVTTYSGPFFAGFDDAYAFTMVLTSIWGLPLTGRVIDPGLGVFADVGLHVAQSAEQSSRYSFTLQYNFVNWNE